LITQYYVTDRIYVNKEYTKIPSIESSSYFKGVPLNHFLCNDYEIKIPSMDSSSFKSFPL